MTAQPSHRFTDVWTMSGISRQDEHVSKDHCVCAKIINDIILTMETIVT